MKKNYIFIGFMAASIAVALYILIPGYSWNSTTPARSYLVGILARGSFYEPAVEGYKKKMAELGYIEGKNIIYDIRFINDRAELANVVRQFIEKKVDLIHVYSTPATQVAYELTKNDTKPIPIVFGSMGDPLASGVIKDIQRPGTHVTGVASLSTELTATRLELLKEINSGIKRVAMPHTVFEAGDVAANKSVEIARDTAAALGIQLRLYPVKSAKEHEAVAQSIRSGDVDGMIIGGDSLILGAVELYAERAKKEKIPFAAFDLSNVQKGALVGFGPDYQISGEQAALISHQILRGRNPAEIGVEVPDRLLLAVNLTTARAIGITFPEPFLQRVNITVGN